MLDRPLSFAADLFIALVAFLSSRLGPVYVLDRTEETSPAAYVFYLSLPLTASILALCARYFASGVLVCGRRASTVPMEKASAVLTFPHIIR